MVSIIWNLGTIGTLYDAKCSPTYIGIICNLREIPLFKRRARSLSLIFSDVSSKWLALVCFTSAGVLCLPERSALAARGRRGQRPPARSAPGAPRRPPSAGRNPSEVGYVPNLPKFQFLRKCAPFLASRIL